MNRARNTNKFKFATNRVGRNDLKSTIKITGSTRTHHFTTIDTSAYKFVRKRWYIYLLSLLSLSQFQKLQKQESSTIEIVSWQQPPSIMIKAKTWFGDVFITQKNHESETWDVFITQKNHESETSRLKKKFWVVRFLTREVSDSWSVWDSFSDSWVFCGLIFWLIIFWVVIFWLVIFWLVIFWLVYD